MNRIKIVAFDSLKKQLKSVSFWAIVIVPVLMMFVTLIIGYFMGNSYNKINLVADDKLVEYLPSDKEKYELISLEDARARLDKNKIDSFVHFSEKDGQLLVDMESKNIDASAISQVMNIASTIQNDLNIRDSGISQEQNMIFQRQPILNMNQVDQGKSMLMQVGYFILLIFMYIMLLMYSNILVVEIATEKGSKMIEFIFSSIKPKEYFAGKILGNFFAIIIHSLIYVIFAIIAFFIGRSKGILDMLNININIDQNTIFMLIEILVIVVLTMLAYMIISAMLGSMANKQEDAGKVATPLMFVVIAGFMISMIFMNRPVNTLLRVLSFIPYISVFFMPLRMLKADVGLMGGMISIIILLVALYISYILASRIYKKHILNYNADSFFARIFQRK